MVYSGRRTAMVDRNEKKHEPDKETKELLKANFIVTENWEVECPHCGYEQEAKFNGKNPMQPMTVTCGDCVEDFILTYERD